MTNERSSDDRHWSVRISAGDTRALEELYDACAGPVYRQALSLLGSTPDAEDVLQEVFLRLVRRRGGPIRDLQAYLLTAARHEAFALMRRRRFERPWEEETLASLPASRIEGSAERAVVLDALAGLPAEQREVVMLKVYEQLTFQEIGRVVQASANTVASRYRYALKKLRQVLGGDGDD
jgi:RNA polymerase sigma-70 factor, ECF subfamily